MDDSKLSAEGNVVERGYRLTPSQQFQPAPLRLRTADTVGRAVSGGMLAGRTSKEKASYTINESNMLLKRGSSSIESSHPENHAVPEVCARKVSPLWQRVAWGLQALIAGVKVRHMYICTGEISNMHQFLRDYRQAVLSRKPTKTTTRRAT